MLLDQAGHIHALSQHAFDAAEHSIDDALALDFRGFLRRLQGFDSDGFVQNLMGGIGALVELEDLEALASVHRHQIAIKVEEHLNIDIVDVCLQL